MLWRDGSVGSRPVVGLWRGDKVLLELLAELLELLLGEAGAYLGYGLELLGILVVDRQQKGAVHSRALAPAANMGLLLSRSSE